MTSVGNRSSGESSYNDEARTNQTNNILMSLRKPTELQKIIDSVPKPTRAVPKNGLPNWTRLGLECKLPVPDLPEGKIVFSRGFMGEDIRRTPNDAAQLSFDLTDPNCYNVSYDYVEMHDPHLYHHFHQKSVKKMMKERGFCTQDGRAICKLKEFNQYRKYLYNQFMDRIHAKMKLVDERARDDLTLSRVNWDVCRRRLKFNKAEKIRELLAKVAQWNADEIAEKKRFAQEQERKIQEHLQYLAEYTERQRKERANRARERQDKIKQRVLAAEEMELRRKISTIRLWRINEKKRLARLKATREAKAARKAFLADQKWEARVNAQNNSIQNNAMLLNIYCEDMKAAAQRRMKKAERREYHADLELQRIRLANLKLIHGQESKNKTLVKKMGLAFEKATRGAKGMSMAIAMQTAMESMSKAVSVESDRLIMLGQARLLMDTTQLLPSPPVKVFEEIMENVLMEFTRRHVNDVMHRVESAVRDHAAEDFFRKVYSTIPRRRVIKQRWGLQIASEMKKVAESSKATNKKPIVFGSVKVHESEKPLPDNLNWKSVKYRPPTPVPSKTALVELAFMERSDDLPDPVAIGGFMPERKKLIDMVQTAAKLLKRGVMQRVIKGMDLKTGQVSLPQMKHSMEWGEAVEGLANAAIDNRISWDCGDMRRACDYMTCRILKSLNAEMKIAKENLKKKQSATEEQFDFYTPDKV